MGSVGSGIKQLFSKDGWTGKNSLVQNLFDPGRLFIGAEDSTPNNKPPEEVDQEAAAANERERRRLSTGSRSTVLTGRRSEALSASIGKRMLGGSA